MKHSFSKLEIKNTSKAGVINSDWIGADGVKESWDILLDMLLDENIEPKIYTKLQNKVKEFRKDIRNGVCPCHPTDSFFQGGHSL